MHPPTGNRILLNRTKLAAVGALASLCVACSSDDPAANTGSGGAAGSTSTGGTASGGAAGVGATSSGGANAGGSAGNGGVAGSAGASGGAGASGSGGSGGGGSATGGTGGVGTGGGGAGTGAAAAFFREDFESGSISSTPNPKWSWPSPVTASNFEVGMMLGAQDIYSVSGTVAHTGKFSLRLNFAGRNNWCNMCGSKDAQLSQANISAGCFPIAGGPWHPTVFDKTNGFSTWAVTSSSGTQVCFNAAAATGSALLGASKLSAGDTIKVPYVCGTNGIVGGNISRRSDCDKAINYLGGVSGNDFGYGKTLSRRFYLYAPSTTQLPSTTLKLGYAHFSKNGQKVSNTLKISIQRGRTLELSAPGGKYATGPTGYAIPLDMWHYFEEVFTRESAAGASDGSYKLYVGAPDRGDDLKTPHVVQNNIQIGALLDMSFNGNFQHSNQVSGFIYFDDIVISDKYVGP